MRRGSPLRKRPLTSDNSEGASHSSGSASDRSPSHPFATGYGQATLPQVLDLATSSLEGGAQVHRTPSHLATTPMKTAATTSAVPMGSDFAKMEEEILRLHVEANDREMELIETRQKHSQLMQQHNQLVTYSRAARDHWQATLEAKDRSIARLQAQLQASEAAAEALAGVSAQSHKAEALLKEKTLLVASLERSMSEAQAALEGLRSGAADQQRLQQQRLQVAQEEAQLAQRRASQLAEENQRLLRSAQLAATAAGASAAATAPVSAPPPSAIAQSALQPTADATAAMLLLQQQCEGLRRQLLSATARMLAREGQAKKYKEGVRMLKAKLAAVEGGQADGRRSDSPPPGAGRTGGGDDVAWRDTDHLRRQLQDASKEVRRLRGEVEGLKQARHAANQQADLDARRLAEMEPLEAKVEELTEKVMV